MVHDAKLGREVKKRDWEIELFGTRQAGRHAAVDSPRHRQALHLGARVRPRRPELWRRPGIPATQLEALGVRRPTRGGQPGPEAAARSHRGGSRADPRPLPLEEYCEDRDGWLQVGMALHHEFGGDEAGYQLWKEFSEQSDKFDEKRPAHRLEQLQAEAELRAAWRRSRRSPSRPEMNSAFDDSRG
jgi:hypothetical protein